MSPLFLAVLAIVAVYCVASVARGLRMELDHRRRPRPPRRDRIKRPDRAA